MRRICLAIAPAVGAQERKQEKKVDKKVEKRAQAAAHKKATPEQIRKFNEVAKKRQAEAGK